MRAAELPLRARGPGVLTLSKINSEQAFLPYAGSNTISTEQLTAPEKTPVEVNE